MTHTEPFCSWCSPRLSLTFTAAVALPLWASRSGVGGPTAQPAEAQGLVHCLKSEPTLSTSVQQTY